MGLFSRREQISKGSPVDRDVYSAQIEDPTSGEITLVTAASEAELDSRIDEAVASAYPEPV
ncbi:hypothetical protein [Branchiibius sp. NY16-3462-2]|uniref:hypothetical protein n=1 Tax=Branchiibius sp. NY16-3462-2 TaxID=1807500 RepID=UPI0007956BCB|nr:hypothetical protein [Branchiibius sp. NY16-3462-2]KYH43876.1 hypothetical protein AZH51_15700 [Branchiibius sp. NY16-3462-2]